VNDPDPHRRYDMASDAMPQTITTKPMRR
jgi:hypothetical protein